MELIGKEQTGVLHTSKRFKKALPPLAFAGVADTRNAYSQLTQECLHTHLLCVGVFFFHAYFSQHIEAATAALSQQTAGGAPPGTRRCSDASAQAMERGRCPGLPHHGSYREVLPAPAPPPAHCRYENATEPTPFTFSFLLPDGSRSMEPACGEFPPGRLPRRQGRDEAAARARTAGAAPRRAPLPAARAAPPRQTASLPNRPGSSAIVPRANARAGRGDGGAWRGAARLRTARAGHAARLSPECGGSYLPRCPTSAGSCLGSPRSLRGSGSGRPPPATQTPS